MDKTRDPGLTLTALRSFVAVVEAGSFSRAAQQLGVSQPSVSLQLTGLERACGVLLLHRKPQLQPTDAGRELLLRARLILSRLDEFEGIVAGLQGLRQGQLSVGMSGPHVAMRLVAGFLRQHPGITLSTRIGNTTALLADVAQCRTDVALVALTAPPPGLACRSIYPLRLAACLPQGHALARRRSVTAREVARLPFISREVGSVTRQLAEQLFATAGLTPQVAHEVTGREAMKEAVVAGMGIGALFAQEAEGDARLAAVPIADAAPAAIHAVALEESLGIPVVRAFWDHAAMLEGE